MAENEPKNRAHRIARWTAVRHLIPFILGGHATSDTNCPTVHHHPLLHATPSSASPTARLAIFPSTADSARGRVDLMSDARAAYACEIRKRQ